MDHKRIKLWDLPTRLFHWLLVILIAAAIITGQIGGGAIEWHGRIGLSILGLIAFRLTWGLIGSSHARFASFFPTPSSVRAYLKGQWKGVGHNPLGSFSVFGLLALITLQVTTGLLGNDDIAFNGPLSGLISKALSDKLTGVHEFTSNLLIALIVLHLAAIVFYVHVKKDNLLKPMITGWKEVKPEEGESATGGGILAFVVALIIALAAVYGGSGEWIPAPPPATVPAATW
ncbi:MAG: cytochrome b/b6 domain-containing protein [Betaproteobacteria bacterium]